VYTLQTFKCVYHSPFLLFSSVFTKITVILNSKYIDDDQYNFYRSHSFTLSCQSFLQTCYPCVDPLLCFSHVKLLPNYNVQECHPLYAQPGKCRQHNHQQYHHQQHSHGCQKPGTGLLPPSLSHICIFP